jgi:hypothetical protein
MRNPEPPLDPEFADDPVLVSMRQADQAGHGRRPEMAAHPAPETSAALPAAGINYERLYTYRFRDVDQASRQAVWQEIARYAHARMGAPQRVRDPAPPPQLMVPGAVRVMWAWAIPAEHASPEHE